ncbi:MAG: FAD-binding oxidoreductase [Nocardioides sp.]
MGRPLTVGAGSPPPPDDYTGLSLWHADRRLDWTPRTSLSGRVEADVVVVGAGFTGLWTAFYLAEADPTLRIVVVEAEVAGYGASGRNGGWCSALFPASLDHLARLPGSSRAAALAQHRAMQATVDEVGRVATDLAVPFTKGGTVVLARTDVQLRRARAEVEHARSWGRDDLTLLDAAEATDRVQGTSTRGATYTPDCAAINPALLVRRLAEEVERRGVRLLERSRVTNLGPRVVTTTDGSVHADVVVRATEGWTPTLSGSARAVIPVYSLVTATEPLPPATWAEIGLARRETFSDHRHLIVYGQRTDDDRLVFGGRGAPYHLGSRVRPDFDRDTRVFAGLRAALVDLFPVLASARFTHAWGGPLGIPRDWCASVGLDRATGLAWAGGYVGDGVSTTNLAGRTLRDLVLDRDTELTRLPWVGHRSRAWEPEPLRWLGVNAGLRAMTLADAEERLTRRPSAIARAMAPWLGG